MPAFDLDLFLPYRLSLAAARVSRRFARCYEAQTGLTNPEWRVMAHLSQSGSVSVRDIHLRVDMDKSRVSRAAQRLEEAGLVARATDASDRRLVALSLTAEGEALMARMAEIADAFQAELLAELGPAAPGLDTGLSRLIDRGGA